jgi:hypothetical protein
MERFVNDESINNEFLHFVEGESVKFKYSIDMIDLSSFFNSSQF